MTGVALLDVFGPLVTGGQVAKAAQDTLIRWLPTYLAEMERRRDLDAGSLPPPRSWLTANTFTREHGQQLPAGIVIAPGAPEFERDGSGTYGAWFDISVAVVVSGNTAEEAYDFATLYAAVAMLILLHKGSLGGIASRTVPGRFEFDVVPADYLKTGFVGQADLKTLVPAVVTDIGGPSVPDLDPDSLPEFSTVEIDVERRSLQ